MTVEKLISKHDGVIVKENKLHRKCKKHWRKSNSNMVDKLIELIQLILVEGSVCLSI